MKMLIFLLLSFNLYAAKGGGRCDVAPDCEVAKNADKKAHGLEICKDSKKVVRRKIDYSNGVMNGIWECFDENGKLTESRQYKNDLLNGVKKLYHPRIDRFEEVSFKDDLQDGIHHGYFTSTSGGVETVTQEFFNAYLKGQRHGWSIVKNLNGEEAKRDCFQNDQLERKNPEKCGSLEGLKVQKDEALNGLVEKKNKDGVLISSLNYKNNKLDGMAKYYRQGNLSSTVYYKDGVTKGIETRYNSSGKIKVEIDWLGLESFSKYKEYFDNGELKVEVHLTKASTDLKSPSVFKFKQFSDNGKSLKDGECVVYPIQDFDGTYCPRFSGKSMRYSESGEMISQEEFLEGKRNGLSVQLLPDSMIKSFFEKGILTKKEFYDREGKILSKTEEFYPDGSKK